MRKISSRRSLRDFTQFQAMTSSGRRYRGDVVWDKMFRNVMHIQMPLRKHAASLRKSNCQVTHVTFKHFRVMCTLERTRNTTVIFKDHVLYENVASKIFRNVSKICYILDLLSLDGILCLIDNNFCEWILYIPPLHVFEPNVMNV